MSFKDSREISKFKSITESLIKEDGLKRIIFMSTLAMTPYIKGEKEPVSVVSKIFNILKTYSVVIPDPYIFGPPGSESFHQNAQK